MFDPQRVRSHDGRFYTHKGQVIRPKKGFNNGRVIDPSLVEIYEDYLLHNQMVYPEIPDPPIEFNWNIYFVNNYSLNQYTLATVETPLSFTWGSIVVIYPYNYNDTFIWFDVYWAYEIQKEIIVPEGAYYKILNLELKTFSITVGKTMEKLYRFNVNMLPDFKAGISGKFEVKYPKGVIMFKDLENQNLF